MYIWYNTFYKALLQLGKRIISNSNKNNNEKHLVFALTDGEDNEYRTTIPEVYQYYKDNGLILMIITIGVGEGTTSKLLQLVGGNKDMIVSAKGDNKDAIDEAMKSGYDYVISHGAVVMETL